MIDIDTPPPDATQTGYCSVCQEWTSGARVVAEIHGDTGCGATVLRCAGCDARAKVRVGQWRAQARAAILRGQRGGR
ncbi:hypothetical protein ACEZCY_14810 [Streptacidiphilus sp. N1-12]|uniref:Uncharacterized protein n=2 Tax=Streptacidiphilus alkalitolerans TaxID=3342712 RepID=A0ABV6VA53_9ACTN